MKNERIIAWSPTTSLLLSPLKVSSGASLFNSSFINQESPSTLLVGEEDMMLVLMDLAENNKKRKQKIFPRYRGQ